jgi:hypothetical protein
MNLPTDEQMQAMLAHASSYTAVFLHRTPRRAEEGADAIVWEHGRRNFGLHADGRLAAVCPVTDGTDLAGIALFALDEAATRAVMDADPAVLAGVFTYETHACMGFVGAAATA